jgi:predicted metalloprotease with PDZ domain
MLPSVGITAGGWKLIYNQKPNEEIKLTEQQRKFLNLSYSIGLIVNPDGVVLDVNPELAAARSGLAPGMKIVGVNGRSWSAETLHDAITATKDATTSIEVRVENGGFQETYKVAYRGGERYPHLERDVTGSNLLDDIIRPHSH